MLAELEQALTRGRHDEARRLITEIANRETLGPVAYRSAPRSTTSEDLTAAQECVLALARADPVAAYYRITDRRRGAALEVTTLCLDAVARALLARGERLLAAGAWSAAPSADFDTEIEAALLTLRIDRLALDGLISEAGVKYWQRAIDASPDDAIGWLCLGLHARTAGDDELARRAAERAIELEPAAPDAHLLLAELFDEAGDARGARLALERGAERAPDPGLLSALGEVLERAEQLTAARNAFDRALELDTESGAALEGRRRVLAATEDWDALAEHLVTMIELASDLDQAELLRRERHAICVERLGLGDRVLEERREAAEERRRALREFDEKLAEGLANAPPEPDHATTGSPLWILAAIALALAVIGAIAGLR